MFIDIKEKIYEFCPVEVQKVLDDYSSFADALVCCVVAAEDIDAEWLSAAVGSWERLLEKLYKIRAELSRMRRGEVQTQFSLFGM